MLKQLEDWLFKKLERRREKRLISDITDQINEEIDADKRPIITNKKGYCPYCDVSLAPPIQSCPVCGSD